MILRRLPAAVLLAALLVLPRAAAAAPRDPAGPAALTDRLAALAQPALRNRSDAAQAEALSLPARGAGSLLRDADSRPVVEVVVDGDPSSLVAPLEAAGASVLHVSDVLRTITAAVPTTRLIAVAGVRGVRLEKPVLTPVVRDGAGDAATAAPRAATCAPVATSEGDAQLSATTARGAYGVDGTGVTVGVLSDSFAHVATSPNASDDVASGDLPGVGNPCGRTTPVTVLADGPSDPSVPDTDEGRAMLQIVHDLAPGARLDFATAAISPSSFADDIRALKAQGANVLVDDIAYLDEPYFQDSAIANAVSDVVAGGATYFSASGNDNYSRADGTAFGSWETPAYRAATCPTAVAAAAATYQITYDCEDFDASGATLTQLPITVSAGGSLSATLQWAQPLDGVTTDFDAYLLDKTGAIIGSSTDDNVQSSQEPFELAGVDRLKAAGATLVIARDRSAARTSPRLKVQLGGSLTDVTYPALGSGEIVGPTIYGHAGTAAAVSVAAIDRGTTTSPESYSSHGPVTHYFGPERADGKPAAALSAPAVLTKPDVTATDCIHTTFFYGAPKRFCGTSAAAPHAAAVAALQLQASPTLTPAQVLAGQTSTARAVGVFGPLVVGAGLIDANAAVGANPPGSTPPATTPPPTTTPPAMTTPASATPPATTTPPATAQPPASTPAGTPVATSTTPKPSDHTKPTTKLRSHPAKRTHSRRARFTFSASEKGVTFTCRVGSARFTRCKSPRTVTLKPGARSFSVRATDAARNVGKTVTYRWRVTP